MTGPVLGLFAKYPEPGQVKTRLAPPLSLEQAAGLYRAMLLDIFEQSAHQAGARRALWFSPAEHRSWFATQAVGFELYLQQGDGLGRRMHHFFETHSAEGSRAMVLRGTDSPTLPTSQIALAFGALDQADLVIGPGPDGGYNLIGLREPCAELFKPAMSQGELLRQTLDAAAELGLRTRLLEPFPDVDTIEDLRALEPGPGAPRTARWIEHEHDSIAP